VLLRLFFLDLSAVFLVEVFELFFVELELALVLLLFLSLLLLDLFVDSCHVIVFEKFFGLFFLTLGQFFGLLLLFNVLQGNRDCFRLLHLQLWNDCLLVTFSDFLATLFSLFEVINALVCIVVFTSHELFYEPSLFFKAIKTFFFAANLIGQLFFCDVLVNFFLVLLFLFFHLFLLRD